MRRIAVLAALAGFALAAPAIAHGAPTIQRPNPLFVTLKVDYINPLPTPTGVGEAILTPVQFKTTNHSMRDLQFLRYAKTGDLGGYLPATVGATFQKGGQRLVGRSNKPEIPLYGIYETNLDRSYTWLHGIGTGPLSNEGGGAVFVPGLGVPPVVAPPTNGNTAPPANQGFAGKPGGTTTTTIVTTVHGSTTVRTTTNVTTGRTTTKKRTTTARTTTTTSTTVPPPPTLFTTTSPPTTTGSNPPSPPPPPPTDCGTIDVSVSSDRNCLFIITNAKPGDSIVENYTIKNTGKVTYDLSLNITNDIPPDDHLWNDLTMGIWETPGPAPNPFPPLTDWVPSFITLDTLHPGDTIHLRVDCLLPYTAGNVDMNRSSVMTLHFMATG
ncbi:MAG TPA: hypothetical protein VGH52_04265 [Gaiellaceae bacterium]